MNEFYKHPFLILFLATLLIAGTQLAERISTKPIQQSTATPTPSKLVKRYASPNGKFEALLIESEKTMIHKDKQVFYIPGSDNVWIFETESRKYTQITEHIDFVYRDNIQWTPDNMLLFTEGTHTVSKFDTNSNTKITLLGPTTPKPRCADACSNLSNFVISPNKTFYIRLTDGIDDDSNTAIEWVNIRTNNKGKVEGQYRLVIDDIKFTSENQFTIPSQTMKPTGTYGDATFGPEKILTVQMN